MSLYNDASLVMVPSAIKDGKLYSIRPTDGSGDFTFTRGSNLAATRVDVNGLIEKGRENVLLQSNQFDTSWGSSAYTLTPNQLGYDGTYNAWLIDKNTTSNNYVTQTSGITGVYTASVYAKAGTLPLLMIYCIGGYGTWNLETGTFNSGGGGYIRQSIEPVGNGWYRIQVSGLTTSVYYLQPKTAQGAYAEGSVYIQNAQLEQGLVATDYIETTTTTAQAGILEDMPRLDYSGGASCPSLLLEPQRSNLVTQSEYINGIGLSKIGSSIDTNVSSSPEGLVNASLLKEDSSSGSHFAYKDFNLTNGATYTISIFAKSNGENRNLQLGDGGVGWSSGFLSNFDLTLGTSTNNGVIEDYGNGWYRCSVVGTTNASSSRLIIYSTLNTATSYQGDGVSGVYLYGFQVESGSYPTSYIPTYGSAVTRNQDVCNNAGNASTFNDSEGVLYVEMSALADSNENRILSVSDGTISTRALIQYYTSSNTIRGFVQGGGISATLSYTASDITANTKIAFKYKSGDHALWVNGTERNTDSTAITLSGLDDFSFDNGGGAAAMYANVKQVLYFPTALTDAECIALTTL